MMLELFPRAKLFCFTLKFDDTKLYEIVYMRWYDRMVWDGIYAINDHYCIKNVILFTGLICFKTKF